jgi:hypothetical protein
MPPASPSPVSGMRGAPKIGTCTSAP